LASTLATLVQKYAIRILIGYKYGYYTHIYVICIQIGWPLWPKIWPHWPLASWHSPSSGYFYESI